MNQGAENREPRTLGDTPMTATYVRVAVLEAVVIAALWLFGRVFS
jgi:hypothetical protein